MYNTRFLFLLCTTKRNSIIIIINNNNKKRQEKKNEPPKRLQAYLEERVLKGCNAGELFQQRQWQLVTANVDCCDEQHFKKPFIEAVSNCVASVRNWRFWPITSKEAGCKTRTNNAAKKKCVPANQEYFCDCLRMMRDTCQLITNCQHKTKANAKLYSITYNPFNLPA